MELICKNIVLKKCVIAMLFGLALFADSEAQTIKIFGENEGLLHPFIQDVVQDSMGYVWVATTDGAYRFNGSSFDVFKHDVSDSLSLAGNNIQTFYVDPDKSALWIGTNFGGISKLNFKDYSFDNFQRPMLAGHEDGIGVVESMLRIDNKLFIGSKENGLQICHLNSRRFDSFSIDGVSDNYTVCDLIVKDSVLFVATVIGLFEYDIRLLKDHVYRLQRSRYFQETEYIKSLSIEDDNALICCENNKLIRIDLNKNKKELIFASDRGLTLLTTHYIDEQKNVWLGTYGAGLIQVDTSGNVKKWFTTDEYHLGTLPNNWISSFCFSKKQSLLWVGTRDGLAMFDLNRKRFRHYKVGEQVGRNANNLFFLHKDAKGMYWWWSYNGLFRGDKNGNFSLFKSSDGEVFTKDKINGGCEYDKHLFLCSKDGLLKIDVEDDSFERIKFRSAYSDRKSVNVLNCINRQGDNLWISSSYGLIQFNITSGSYSIFHYPKAFENVVEASCLVFDENGILWIGDKRGYVLSFDFDNTSFQRYSSAVKISSSRKMQFNSVLGIHFTKDNKMWLATYGSGLLTFDRESKKISPGSSNEILSDVVYNIKEDKSGYLWMNSNSKIIRYSPTNDQILSYGRHDGTVCREFNEDAGFMNSKGEILMGGSGGFVEFNVDSFQYNNILPSVDIGSYFLEDDHDMVGGKVRYNLEYLSSDTLEIFTGERSISFNASVLNYINSDKNIVAWKLEGYEETWDTLMATHPKSYAMLPEGVYNLKVKGCNNDQLWNNKGDEIVIIVKPTFFQSKLFKILFLVACFIIIYSAYLLRYSFMKRQRKRLEEMILDRTHQLQEANFELEESKEEIVVQKHELERHRYYLEDLVKERTFDLEKAKERAEESDRLKTSFLANLSHEIRTPMNSIIGFSTLLLCDEYEPEERHEFANIVQKNSESLLLLIDDIIDISRIETGQIQLIRKPFSINELCATVFKSLTFNRANHKVSYFLDMDDIAPDELMYSDPERLKQILNNLVSNALKFTSEGHVRMKVLKSSNAKEQMLSRKGNGALPDNYYLFTVEDTGIGIDSKYHENIFSPFRKVEEGVDIHGGIGLGLSIVKQLVEMLDGEIWIESQLNMGTVFFFYIPKDSRNESI